MIIFSTIPQWVSDIAGDYLDSWRFDVEKKEDREILYIVNENNQGMSVGQKFENSNNLTLDDKSTIYHNIKRFADGIFFEKEF